MSKQQPAKARSWRGAKAESGFYARVGLPILITQLSMMANGVVDTLMAGRSDKLQLGSFVHETGLDAGLELAGVAIGNGIWVSLMMAGLGLLFATTPMVAELYGAGMRHSIGNLVRRLALPAILVGLALCILGWLAAWLIEPWMRQDVGEVTAGYLRLVALGGLPLALATLLRCYSEGMTLTLPFTAIGVIGVLLNIPLNAIFIYGLFGFPTMGGVGCAVATAVSNWILFGLAFALVRLAPWYRETHLFSRWHLPYHRYTVSRLWRLGAPIALTLLVELSMFPGMTLLIAIMHLPNADVAGHQIAMNMAGVLYMFPLAVALTATVRMGNLVGGGHQHSLPAATRFPLYTASAIAAVNTLLLFFFRDDLASFYSRLPEVVAVASHLMLYAMIFQWLDALQGTSLGILRGLSSTFWPMVCIGFSYWGVGIPVAYVTAFVGLPGMEPMGISGLWLGMTVGLAMASITMLSYQAWFVPRKRIAMVEYAMHHAPHKHDFRRWQRRH